MSGVKQKSGLWGAAVPALAEESNSGSLNIKVFVYDPASSNHHALDDPGKTASA